MRGIFYTDRTATYIAYIPTRLSILVGSIPFAIRTILIPDFMCCSIIFPNPAWHAHTIYDYRGIASRVHGT
jgi:hypothetical protein